MIREVCLYDKFSFCKNGVKCMKVHLKEVCQNRACDYRKCNKRHPRPCRIFSNNGFCRFGISCRYSHRPSKEMEEQNKVIEKQNQNIESLRETTSNLSKQVADQNDELKDLRKRLLEIEKRDLKRLQEQVDALLKTNIEKEKVIKVLKDIKENLKIQKMSVEDVSNNRNEGSQEQVHEISDIEERCKAETVKKATIEYAHKCLDEVEKVEMEVHKIKKNDDNLGFTLMTKCQNFCERLDEIEVKEELCEDVIERVSNLKEFLSFAEKKPDKDRNLRSIRNCKKFLKGFLKYPKRPSQITQFNCCKVCSLSSLV